MSVHDWRELAACRSSDPEIFFPAADSGPSYVAQVAVAKTICAGCPVRAECLAEALTRIPFGIAGGLTPEERRGARHRVGADPVAVLEVGLRAGASRTEIEAAGRVLLIAGRPAREVARRCRVSERTAIRWATRLRTPPHDHEVEGSAAATAAPLRFSRSNDLLMARITEGA